MDVIDQFIVKKARDVGNRGHAAPSQLNSDYLRCADGAIADPENDMLAYPLLWRYNLQSIAEA